MPQGGYKRCMLLYTMTLCTSTGRGELSEGLYLDIKQLMFWIDCDKDTYGLEQDCCISSKVGENLLLYLANFFYRYGEQSAD
ncbi:hypothetical protein AVEN_103732-1, partial [Araneus ventricosus]